MAPRRTQPKTEVETLYQERLRKATLSVPSTWHIHRVSKRGNENPPPFTSRGLLNPGVLCYRNATLQAMLHHPRFAEWALHHDRETCRQGCYLCPVYDVLGYYWHRDAEKDRYLKQRKRATMDLLKHMYKGYRSTAGFQASFPNRPIKDAGQQDAAEFFGHFAAGLEATVQNDDLVHGLLGIQVQETATCTQCQKKRVLGSGGPANEFSLIVHPAANDHTADPVTLESLIKQRFANQEDFEVNCPQPNCDGKHATREEVIANGPSFLCIQIARFNVDNSQSTAIPASKGGKGRRGATNKRKPPKTGKIRQRVEMTDKLDLTQYIDREGARNAKLKYSLVGVVQHAGSLRSGHYIAFAKKANSRWAQINDEVVSCSSKDRAMHPWKYNKNSKDAFDPYLLIYEKLDPNGLMPGREVVGAPDPGVEGSEERK